MAHEVFDTAGKLDFSGEFLEAGMRGVIVALVVICTGVIGSGFMRVVCDNFCLLFRAGLVLTPPSAPQPPSILAHITIREHMAIQQVLPRIPCRHRTLLLTRNLRQRTTSHIRTRITSTAGQFIR